MIDRNLVELIVGLTNAELYSPGVLIEKGYGVIEARKSKTKPRYDPAL